MPKFTKVKKIQLPIDHDPNHDGDFQRDSIRLKTMVLQGFKSFPDRTVFEFGHKICAIVGPNGCGKSNVLDAFRWVLGEQGPSQLRAQSMSDVLFNGSADRKPLGMSDVTITLKAGGQLPVRFEEVEVTRRLYRSGESEYLINRVPCRLKDIVDLFLDAGMGKGAYSLIEQGRVDALLIARPAERRGLIEQAAGIMKYKVRKKEAINKLNATSRNLERIQDVLAEVKSRRIILARQANKAKKYRKLKSEHADIHTLIYTARYGQLKKKLENAQKEYEKMGLQLAQITSKMGLSAASLEKAKERVESAENELKKARHRAEQFEFEIDRLEERRTDAKRRLNDYQTEYEASKIEAKDLNQRSERLQEKKKEFNSQIEQLILDIREFEKKLASERIATSKFDDELDARRRQLKDMKKRHFSALENTSRLRNKFSQNEEATRRIRQRLETLHHEKSSRQEESRETDIQKIECQGKIQDLERIIYEYQQSKSEIDNQIRIKQARIDELRGQIHEVEARSVSLKSRLASIEEVVAAKEGLGDGVKSILNDYPSQKNNEYFGIIADLFETDSKYEKAVAAALEWRFQDVVVASHVDVHDAVSFLNEKRRGRCTFTPLHPKIFDTHGLEKDFDSNIQPLAQLVSTPKQYAKLFHQLLADTYLVDNLDDALTFWKREKKPVTIVTLNGEVIRPEGAITGGFEKSGGENYRLRKKEIESLKSEIKNSKLRVENLNKEKERWTNIFNELCDKAENLREQLAEKRIHLAGVKSDLNHIERRIKTIGVRENAVDSERELLNEELGILLEKQEIIEHTLQENQPNKKDSEKIAHSENDLENIREKLDRCRNHMAQTELMMAKSRERLASANQQIKQLDEEITNVDNLVIRLEKRAVSVAKQKEQMSEKIVDLDDELTSIINQRPRMEAHIRNLHNRWQREKDAELDLHREFKTLEKEQRNLEHDMETVRMKKVESESARNVIIEEVNIDFDVMLRKMDKLPDDAELYAWRERLKDLEAQIQGMGDVNLAAVDEHAELVDRNRYLDEQLTDLNESMQALKKTISQINRTSRRLFMDAYEKVNQFFAEIFQELFHGGEAALKLQDPDDPLETGIEIMCSPPGKRAKNIDLLSGGEKALSALALLFASFKFRPAPVIFLDEVDASLDDTNVIRFCRYLKTLANETQIIMVSHNPLTVEVADVLYGITMSEPGISRLVSAKFDD